MKLYTSIPARKDGTVKVLGLDGATHVFERDGDGELSGEIEHAPTVASLLAGGLFCPADAADYEEALVLTAADDEGDGDEGGAGSEDEGNGLPVEANTPPAPARARPGRKPKADAE